MTTVSPVAISSIFHRASVFFKDDCGANARGGGGFQPGNTCSKEDAGGFGSGRPSSTNRRGENFHSVKLGAGKVWRDQKGKPVPRHIRKIAIPPGWRDVEVNPDPKGTVLVKGVDSKGRPVSKYSDSYQAKQAAKKFRRTRELLKKRDMIFMEIEKDAKSSELKERAECLKLVMQTGMRPGSDEDTLADHKSFGATTMKGSHVIQEDDGTVTLRLVTGKNKGREVDFVVTDKSTAKMLIRRKEEAGDDGRLFDTDAQKLREYSSEKDGKGFRTKDHRTALGTETAISTIKAMETPNTEAEFKEAVKEVSTAVAKVLGNTPKIALKSYIDPQVFVAWKKVAK